MYYWVFRDGWAYAYKRVACYAHPTKDLIFRDPDCYIRWPEGDYKVDPDK